MKHEKKQSAPTWVTLPINGETLHVLRVWQLNEVGHEWPETAILRALTTGAKQQAEDPAVLLEFLNDNDVFSKDVNVVTPQVSVQPGLALCNPPHWNFIVMHGRTSNAVVVEVPCFK